MVSFAETRPMIGEEEHTALFVEPMVLPLEAVMQDFSEKISIDGAPMKTAPKMSVERYSEKDPTEVARIEKMVNNSEKDLVTMMKTEGSLEMVTPAWRFLSSASHVEPSNSIPRAPSTVESLQSAMEYLRNLQPSVERLFLDE